MVALHHPPAVRFTGNSCALPSAAIAGVQFRNGHKGEWGCGSSATAIVTSYRGKDRLNGLRVPGLVKRMVI
jgi:hypothetical protein